jgi:hypothetical protein
MGRQLIDFRDGHLCKGIVSQDLFQIAFFLKYLPNTPPPPTNKASQSRPVLNGFAEIFNELFCALLSLLVTLYGQTV